MKTRLTGVSFGLALAAAIFLLVWPIYTGSNGKQTSHATLLQVNGPYILIPVMFPVLTTLIALLLRKQAVRIVATILLGGFAVIAGFTIGLFYLPAAIPMLPASCVRRLRQAARRFSVRLGINSDGYRRGRQQRDLLTFFVPRCGRRREEGAFPRKTLPQTFTG
jgi:ABC-type transport system involved in multi-copper enzyme maturation permease subunit